jgi:hypothetical protein
MQNNRKMLCAMDINCIFAMNLAHCKNRQCIETKELDYRLQAGV